MAVDDAAALGGGVGAVVDGGEDDLVAAAAVDGVHVVDERLHRLVDAADGLVDGMLEGAVAALEADEVALDVVVDPDTLEIAVVHVEQLADLVHLFIEGLADERGEVEVEGRDGLAAVHLVLHRFHGDAGEDGGRLDALGRAGLAVAGAEAVLEDEVQRVLDAGQGLGRIIVLVVDMDVVLRHGVADIVGEEALVHIALGRLGGELHHHARRGVGVHVGVLPGDVVGLRVDDGLENLRALGLAGHVALVAVADVFLGDLLAGAVHQFVLDDVLDLFHGHFLLVDAGNRVGDLGGEDDILSVFRHIHGFQDGGDDFLVVEFDVSSVAFQYSLDHIRGRC